ncbi:MAG: TonB-dependent siderophore receptor [Phenylobacterium sp.]|nr:TonB-dependent siderophore receptor [Phenylobacterium sp.]
MTPAARTAALALALCGLSGCVAIGARVSASPATPRPTYAQALVDREIARHPDLKILVLHVTPPGQADNVIVASNIGRLGKKADADDLSVLASGAPRAEVTRNGYSVEQILHDARGRTLGVVATTFAYAPGDDTTAVMARAAAVERELAAATPSLTALVSPAR